MLLHAPDELADRVIAATEERRVLFAERLQTPVRADRRADGGRRNRLAAQRGAERFEAVGLLTDICPFAEVDPGEELQEPGRRGIAASPVCRMSASSRSYCWVLPIPCLPTRMATALDRPIASSSAGIHRRPGRSALRSKKVLRPWALSQPFSSAAAPPSLWA